MPVEKDTEKAIIQISLARHQQELRNLEEKAQYNSDFIQRVQIANAIEYERAEIARLQKELLALEETQSPEDDKIELGDSSGSAVAVGSGATVTTTVIGRPDWSYPMSEVLEELNRVKGTIADLTSRFDETTARRMVTASIFGDVGGIQQGEDLCFVLMPFGDDMLQQVYEVHIKPTVERVGLQCKRADDMLGPAAIMEDIWKGINSARVVLAELTGQNPNVFYELGLCHATGKDAILMAQDIKWVPFDVRHRRTIIYTPTPRGCKQLEEVLGKTLEAVLGKVAAE